MKRLVGILLVLGTALLGTTWVYGQSTLEVCPTCSLTSLKTAIAQANPHDKILVNGGSYTEGTILVDKPLTLEGLNQPILDGEGKVEILTITASDVTVRGFTFQNAGISHTADQAALKTLEVENCLIENNTFLNNFFAIYLGKTKHCQVLHNTVKAHATSESFSGNAVHLWDCSEIVVKDNYLSGQRDGVYLEFVKDSLIENNISEANLRYGLHFMYSNNNIFRNNRFRANGAGVAVMYSKNIEMTQNHFEDNWGSAIYGLLLKEINDSRLYNNVFHDNSVGIYVDGANRTDISFNDFSHNGYALRILSSSMGVTIAHNNFYGNSFDVTTNANRSYNAFLENYWEAYQGYDLNHDGFGDVPYRPVRLFALTVENYPQTMILMRSPLEQFMDYAERILPIFTPKAIEDDRPLMRRVLW